MAVVSLQRALLLAGAVLPLGLAQTITGADGEVLRKLPETPKDVWRVVC